MTIMLDRPAGTTPAATITGTITVLHQAGIAPFTWDKSDPTSVAAAAARVKELIHSGHLVYQADGAAADSGGTQIRDLAECPDAENLIAVRANVAG